MIALFALAACGGGGGGGSSGKDSESGSESSASSGQNGDDSGSGEQGGGNGSQTPGGQNGTTPPRNSGGGLIPRVMGLVTDQGLVGPGRIVDSTISFQGTAAASEVVEVYLNGQLAGSSLARSDGSWMLDYSVIPLAPGAYSATLISVTSVGVETAGPAFDFIYDPSAPAAPVISGVINDSAAALDGITNDNTLIITGTAEANSLLELFLNNAPLPFATTTVDADGNWQIDHTLNPLLDGVYTLSAESVYLTLRSATSPMFNLEVDTLAPVAPLISAIAPDTGVSAIDAITSSGNLILSGTAEPNAIVRMFLAGVLVGSSAADGAGNWSLDYRTVTLLAGTHIFSATQMDRAGNVSVLSSPFPVVVGLAIPLPISSVAFSPDSGVVGDGITNANQLVISGTAPLGLWAEISLDGTPIGTVPVDLLGNWSLDYTGTTLADGTYVVTARASDIAGNLSAPTAGLAVTVDTVAPAAPVVNAFTTDTAIAGDGITADNTLIISGSAEAGANVTVLFNGVAVGNASADINGNWNFDYTDTVLADNTYAITATATDSAGNVSLASAAFNIRVDASVPAAPTVLGITDDTGAAGDGITSDANLEINGTAEANAVVTVLINGVSIGTATASGAGVWMFDHSGTALANNSYAITATARDSAGNTSTASSAFNITVDNSAPATPSVSGITDDTGTAGDGITSDNELIISGTAEADASVNLLIDGVSIGTTTTSGAGNWSYDHTGTLLANNSYVITAIATDGAGNTSPTSAGFDITVDASVPAAPTVTGITDDTGTAGDGITNDNALIISGTAEADASVNVLIDGVSIGTTTASGAGSWTYSHVDTALTDNTYAITATAVDSAGNTSIASAALNITVDTIAPTVTTFIPSDNGTDVAHTTNLVLTFDSVVTAQSGNITLRRVADNSIFEQIPVGDARVTGSGTTFITINPTANLVGGVSYYVQIDAGAFVDTAGNGYAGIADNTSWNFAVQDLLLTSSAPADDATDVALNSAFMLYFNTPAIVNAGNIRFRLSSDNSVFETIDVNGGQVFGSGTTSIMVSPLGIFEPNTDYYIEIDAGTFQSNAGASFAGVSGNSTLNFTTINATVPTVTNVTSSTPDGSYGAGATIVVQVQFSEQVTVSGGTPQLTLALDGVDAIVNYSSGSGTSTLVFNYNVMLGDVTADLNYLSTNALSLNGASIRSSNFANANLALPAPAGAGSLGSNKNIVIGADMLDVGNLGDAGFLVLGTLVNGNMGLAVANAGDVNGDGFEDFLVGVPSSGSGSAYVVWGRAGATRSNILASAFTGSDGFRITGAANQDQLGTSVGGVGDLNGDGYDDILVMSPNNDAGANNAGTAYVIWGVAGATRSDVALNAFGSSAGFRILGIEANQSLGQSNNGQAIASGGDFNGDGVLDLVIGQPLSDADASDGGQAYVVFGKRGATRSDVTLDETLIGSDGFFIGASVSSGWQLGQGVNFIGDFNGDGYDDIAVGATFNDTGTTDAGAVFIVFGNEGPNFPTLDVSSLSIYQGFRIYSSEMFGLTGNAIGAGDFNGDGLSDVVVSEHQKNINGKTDNGAVHVVYGFQSGVGYTWLNVDAMLSNSGFTIYGKDANDFMGRAVASAGDFNADGLDDLLLGAPEDSDGGAQAGGAWLILGEENDTRADLDLAALTSAEGFRIQGAAAADQLGYATSHGDVNGDGFDDLILGAPYHDVGAGNAGQAVVLWGYDVLGYVLSLTGDAGDNNIVGTSASDTISGGGGADAIYGGAGNDVIQLSDTAFFRIDGGRGNDTLAFISGGNALDLPTIMPEKIKGIEVIDLGDAGNSLTVSKLRVLALSRQTNALYVRGGGADVVAASSGDAWLNTGTVNVGGIDYNRYSDSGALLYVQTTISQAGVSSLSGVLRFTFNTTSGGANVPGNVTNFPVLVRLTSTYASVIDAVQPGAPDIRFVDSDGSTMLPYEIERWDQANDVAEVWVLVPQVNGNSNTDYITLYYNDSSNGTVPDGQNPELVWADYSNVYHFQDGGAGSGAASDSTVFANNAAQTGTVSRVERDISEWWQPPNYWGVGRSAHFTGSDALTAPYNVSFNVSGSAFTVSGWMERVSCGSYDGSIAADPMVRRGNSGAQSWRFTSAYRDLFGGVYPVNVFIGGDSMAGFGGWASPDCGGFLTLVYDPSSNPRVRFYSDGVLVASTNNSYNVENGSNPFIMGDTGDGKDLYLDEIRHARNAKSANYILLSYQNQRSGSNFISISEP